MGSPSTGTVRLGSLCTGFGGLDLAAEMAFGPVDHAWHAETDPDASRVLAAHWPDVPNLGDLTAVDWAVVEPVDVLVAGPPCQAISVAGRRKGVDDERWLWDGVVDAVGRMVPPPGLLLFENPPGLLTASGGDAMARVVCGLAALGYVGRYRVVSAADVAAPHLRERVFIVAAHADGEPVRPEREDGTAGPGASRRVGAGVYLRTAVTLLPTPTRRDGLAGPGHQGREGGPNLRTAMALLPTPSARDADRGAGWGDQPGRPLSETIHRLLPTPRATDGVKGGPNQHGSSGDLMLPAAVQPERWGDYAAAIARWETVAGPAPEPTVPGRRGSRLLSHHFVEWMMGLPAGWVTDHCARAAALRLLGNGVVPAQGALAFTWLRGVSR